MNRPLRLAALLAILAGAALSAGQTTGPPTPTFKVQVDFVEVDALGHTVPAAGAGSQLEPRQGTTVRTSLDAPLQQFVASVFPTNTRGAIMAMDPRTGEILALYSSPSYDPNVFVGGVDAKVAHGEVAADCHCDDATTRGRLDGFARELLLRVLHLALHPLNLREHLLHPAALLLGHR